MKKSPQRRPCALTIAGSDSGGGAGIQADLKTFSAIGVHGTSAITCITAQNPRKVSGVEPLSTQIITKQIEAVFEELPVTAVKTGMLYSAAIIEAVADGLSLRKAPIIVDPVMISTSGAALLKPKAVKALRKLLIPACTLLTPNLPEAEALSGLSIKTPEDLRLAARTLHLEFGCAVLAKGGHLRGLDSALDIYLDDKEELMLTSPYVRGISTHGTGCTYSAAIAGFLARGDRLPKAVERAKTLISKAIADSVRIGRHWALNPPSALT